MTAAFIALAVPVAFCVGWAVSLADPGLRPRRTLMASRLAAGLALGLAILCAVLVAMHGPATSPVLGTSGVGISVRLDAFSLTILTLVCFVGAIVIQYSRNYLDGDPRQGVFLGGLCLTLAATCLLVEAGNLLQLVPAWIAMSLALHRLLMFYPQRRAAQLAARKKFIVARIGDAALIAAAWLIGSGFRTADIGTILHAARAMSGAAPAWLAAGCLLLAIAALLKSAQFPTHGWLPEVMETPTPVSALLHAGIINAGGFLVIRFADVMRLCPASLDLLVVIGGFTALFASTVMLTQTSVKVSLAWSTVAQMGFMLLECGFGAFALATLHIVAHSLYKAHAFLGSGSVIDIARSSWHPDLKARPSTAAVAGAFAVAALLYGAVSIMLTPRGAVIPAEFTLGFVLALGVAVLVNRPLHDARRSRPLVSTAALAVAVTVSYCVLKRGAHLVFAQTLPLPTDRVGPFDIALMAMVAVSFGLVTVLQMLAPQWIESSQWRRAYVHLSNGFYVNALFNRVTGALRLSRSHAA